jgi:hypothetical protein
MRFNDVGVLVEIAIFNQKKALASASAFFNDVFRCRRDPHFLLVDRYGEESRKGRETESRRQGRDGDRTGRLRVNADQTG